jgi:hypothetical protein
LTPAADRRKRWREVTAVPRLTTQVHRFVVGLAALGMLLLASAVALSGTIALTASAVGVGGTAAVAWGMFSMVAAVGLMAGACELNPF